jgi:hypothetical protein
VIVGVAGCPHPPLLLRGITGRPVAEVEQVRAACLAAIGELLAARPSRLVVIGAAGPGEIDASPDGTSAPHEDAKALSVVVGRLLLSQAGCQAPVEHLVVPAGSSPADCLQAGRALAEADGSDNSSDSGSDSASGRGTGLLVMADGSARRSLKAPGYLDARAAPFDEGVLECLRSGRLGGLAALDPALAAELLVAGRAAWQVLAGAVGDTPGRSRVHYSDDPFGVWYPVFSWLPAQ